MQRTITMIAGLLLAGTPLAAQDTAITIQKRNNDTECTVRINGRQLSPVEAKPICASNAERSALMRLRTDSMRAMVTEMGDRVRELRVDSSATLTRQHAEMLAKEMSALDGQRAFFDIIATREARQRPIIGVSIDPSPGPTDRRGALVVAVTPNGPADKAGIRSGDIIARVAGTAIGAPDRSSAAGGQSFPSIKLIEVVGGLEAGKAVRVEYLRDDKTRNVMVTPIDDRAMLVDRRVDEMPLVERLSLRERRVDSVPVAPDAPRAPWAVALTTPGRSISSFTFTSGAIARIEMAPVNEKLGAYFGVTSGVLVVNVPATGNMTLQPGDVVTAVDGRRIETPNEFLRVLRTYDADRSFTLQVTRQKRQEVITTKLP